MPSIPLNPFSSTEEDCSIDSVHLNGRMHFADTLVFMITDPDTVYAAFFSKAYIFHSVAFIWMVTICDFNNTETQK